MADTRRTDNEESGSTEPAQTSIQSQPSPGASIAALVGQQGADQPGTNCVEGVALCLDLVYSCALLLTLSCGSLVGKCPIWGCLRWVAVLLTVIYTQVKRVVGALYNYVRSHELVLHCVVVCDALLPESKATRRYMGTFLFGFVIGSFLYVSYLNLSYSLMYETRASVKVNPKLVTSTPRVFPPDPLIALVVSKTTIATYKRTAGSRLVDVRPLPEVRQNETEKTPGIPHIIHHYWETSLLPGTFARWMSTWHKNHPGWRHMFWTRGGSSRLVKEHYPEGAPIYFNYSTDVHRERVNRFFILHRYGGVYTDLDMESLKPLDDLLSKYTCVLTDQPLVHQAVLFNMTAPNYLVTSFMACRPGHPFLSFLLNLLDTYSMYDVPIEPNIERVEKSVGSLFLGDVYELYRIVFANRSDIEPVKILDSQAVLPNYNGRYRYTVVERCQQKDKLGKVGKEVCRRLLASDFSNSISGDAYNVCHWIDLYDPVTLSEVQQTRTVDVRHLSYQ